MKILVQGTKGGAKIFYPQTTPDEFYTFAGDVRDINGAGGVSERAYSIALTADGCIFSKYLGVRDVQRSWDGNISFSLFLSNRQSMPGEKIQALLDELLSTYADRYIVDDNLDIVHEDWSFIEEITSRYESYIKTVSGNELDIAEYGNGIPAFLFYDGNVELTKYFEFPYQKEYLPYKQVFLLDKEEQNNTRNLLNALRHNPDANLTGKVDLENPRLTLTNFDANGKGGVRITLKANGQYRQNRSKFFRKDELELTYSKPGYRDKFITGCLSDPMSDINDYVKIVDGNKVDVKNSVELDAEIIEITLRITDETGNVFTPENNNVNVRAYQSKGTFSEKEILSNKVTFIGEETLKWWVVEASSENKKGYEEFKPSDKLYDSVVKVMMKEEKPIEIERKIDTTYRGRNVPSVSTMYYICVDPEKGTLDSSSEKETSSYPSYSCAPKKGYKFVKWIFVREIKKFDKTTYPGYYEAQFKELWWHKIPGGRFTVYAIAIIIVAGLIAWVCLKNFNQKNTEQYDTLVAQIDSIVLVCSNQPESVSLEDLKNLQEELNGLKPDSTKDQDRWDNWKDKMMCLQTAINELKESEKEKAKEKAAVEQHKREGTSTTTTTTTTSTSSSSSSNTGYTPRDQTTYLSDFWNFMIDDDNTKRSQFDSLMGSWKRDYFKNNTWQNDTAKEYYTFYDTYLSDNDKFSKYFPNGLKDIPKDKRKMRNLDRIKNSIEQK